ncbi:MAG: hypothetical protein AABY79_11580 [Nitrospirota bacterium]
MLTGTKAIFKKARTAGIREVQAKLSKLIGEGTLTIITSHGKPKSFLIPYEEMLDLLEILDELKDDRLIEEIARARKEYDEGKWAPAERLFERLGR